MEGLHGEMGFSCSLILHTLSSPITDKAVTSHAGMESDAWQRGAARSLHGVGASLILRINCQFVLLCAGAQRGNCVTSPIVIRPPRPGIAGGRGGQTYFYPHAWEDIGADLLKGGLLIKWLLVLSIGGPVTRWQRRNAIWNKGWSVVTYNRKFLNKDYHGGITSDQTCVICGK